MGRRAVGVITLHHVGVLNFSVHTTAGAQHSPPLDPKSPPRAIVAQFTGIIAFVKTLGLILILLTLTACGAVRAVRETERVLDEYNCLVRELNGELRAMREPPQYPRASSSGHPPRCAYQ